MIGHRGKTDRKTWADRASYQARRRGMVLLYAAALTARLGEERYILVPETDTSTREEVDALLAMYKKIRKSTSSRVKGIPRVDCPD